MMLNLQFAETMELTEAELQAVSGGNIVKLSQVLEVVQVGELQEFTLVGEIKG